MRNQGENFFWIKADEERGSFRGIERNPPCMRRSSRHHFQSNQNGRRDDWSNFFPSQLQQLCISRLMQKEYSHVHTQISLYKSDLPSLLFQIQLNMASSNTKNPRKQPQEQEQVLSRRMIHHRSIRIFVLNRMLVRRLLKKISRKGIMATCR